jgi:hypothetical protein
MEISSTGLWQPTAWGDVVLQAIDIVIVITNEAVAVHCVWSFKLFAIAEIFYSKI